MAVSGAATGEGSGVAGLTVELEGVPSDDGTVRVAVCRQAEYPGACDVLVKQPARAGTMTLTIPEVGRGPRAVQVFHDRNDDGKLNFRWFGPPKEAYGYSNNPAPRMGPARWDEIKVVLTGAGDVLTIRLRGG
nr:DUF2141 domain-containing protein [Rhodothalassium salexigens]